MAAATTTMPTRIEDFLEQNLTQKSDTITVQKAIDLEIDSGNLFAYDVNEINLKEFRRNKEQFLLQLARDNTQLLINSLSQLPVETSEHVTVLKLPEPTTILPREKIVPKPKQLTKWERYARLKGIQKKKKGRMLWDNQTRQYRPRWGYKSKDETKSWLLEVPENADPFEDQFEKKKKEKKERIAKNELQRLRNIARTTKSKVPGVGLTPTLTPSKDQLSKVLAITHKSTASLGKFMDTLPKEKLKGLGKKRKFENNTTNDRDKQKKILKTLTDARPVLDVNRAANIAQHSEERQRAKSKKTEDGEGKKRAGKKGKKNNKGNKMFNSKSKKQFGGKGKKGHSGKGGKKGRKK